LVFLKSKNKNIIFTGVGVLFWSKKTGAPINSPERRK